MRMIIALSLSLFSLCQTFASLTACPYVSRALSLATRFYLPSSRAAACRLDRALFETPSLPACWPRLFPLQYCDTIRNLKALVLALLAQNPKRRVLCLDITEVRSWAAKIGQGRQSVLGEREREREPQLFSCRHRR